MFINKKFFKGLLRLKMARGKLLYKLFYVHPIKHFAYIITIHLKMNKQIKPNKSE